MKDYRKFCRPKFTKIPKLGDIVVKLKCGEIKAMTQDEYIKVQKFFNIYSFVGESSNSSGNIVVVNKETGKKAIFSSNDYDSIKDEFDIVDIVGSKLNPFNNHEYVDLGLPSGTLWATMNVGATSEGELGDYYKFGETTVYDGTDYNTSAYDLAEDLSLENDAANVNWSGDWHIPTKSLWDELISNTTHTYISDYNSTGVNVIKFAKTNDSSTFIILPAGGSYTDGELTNPDTAYYWSNTLYYKSAYYAVFTLNSYFHIDWKTAYGHGFLVRPVCDSINSLKLAQEGDIICHNNILNQDAIFSFNDWLNLSDSWDAIDLYGIETFDNDDEVTEERYVILSNGTTFIIKSTDYSSVSSYWEVVDTISIPIQYEYVDLELPSGTLWSTKNIGSELETDTGLYFQWGDTQGYTAAQVGEGEGQKYFGWADYKYSNNGGSTAADMTKYNETDGKTVLEPLDDAVVANMGSSWRMPTETEFNELLDTSNCTKAWTTNYGGTGINGYLFTSVRNGNTLFFPAAGACGNGQTYGVNSGCNYWLSSLDTSNVIFSMQFTSNVGGYNIFNFTRYGGFSIRGILDE